MYPSVIESQFHHIWLLCFCDFCGCIRRRHNAIRKIALFKFKVINTLCLWIKMSLVSLLSRMQNIAAIYLLFAFFFLRTRGARISLKRGRSSTAIQEGQHKEKPGNKEQKWNKRQTLHDLRALSTERTTQSPLKRVDAHHSASSIVSCARTTGCLASNLNTWLFLSFHKF